MPPYGSGHVTKKVKYAPAFNGLIDMIPGIRPSR